MDLVFNPRGNKKQEDCAEAWLDDSVFSIAYGGAKGGGKSFMGCSLIFGNALIYPETRYFIARKTLTDLVKHTIPSIHEVLNGWGVTENYYKFNGKYNVWDLYNGSKVYFLDAKYMPSDPLYERFGSIQMTQGWLEEAGEFDLECKNALAISLGRWKNDKYGLSKKLLETCNPSKNYLYTEYYKKWRDGTLEPNKRFIQALPTDNKMQPKGYVDGLLDILSYNEAQRLVYGNWEFDDDPTKLFDYRKITDLFTNEFVKGDGERWMTCDIAYEGSDLFVIGMWDGFVLEKIIAIDKIDDTQVSAKINELRVKYRIPRGNIIYDADGLKKFVRQSTKTGFLKGSQPFHNNRRAFGRENYANLKAQCYFKLAEMVENNDIYINNSEWSKQIVEELEQIRKQVLADDGKIRLERKEDLKKRLRRSPDFADMMMMRMLPLVKPSRNIKVKWI